MAVKCPVCDSEDTKPVRRLFDDRFGYPGNFDLHLCADCGHRFLDVYFSDEQLTRLYSDYYPRSVLVDTPYKPAQPSHGLAAWWRGSARSAFRWVPAGSRVLDIGCGGCESLGYLRNLGCEVKGVEADENVREIARRQGFDVHIGTFDPALYKADSFDTVTMDQVIEHVTDPVTTLRGIRDVLNPGGLAILSTPQCLKLGSKAIWTLLGPLARALSPAAFLGGIHGTSRATRRPDLERVENITDSVWLRYQWLHLLTRPAMGQASPFWAGARVQTGRAVMWRRVVTLVHLSGIDHLLTRLFDALGQGDNQLFFLRKSS